MLNTVTTLFPFKLDEFFCYEMENILLLGKTIMEEVILMGKWNEQAAPNNNLAPKTIKAGELVGDEAKQEFSEELSDGGERDQYIELEHKNNRKNMK